MVKQRKRIYDVQLARATIEIQFEGVQQSAVRRLRVRQIAQRFPHAVLIGLLGYTERGIVEQASAVLNLIQQR